MGEANSGHYYSYIKNSENTQEWFEFNDRNVKKFNPDDMGNLAFGGPEKKNRRGWNKNMNMNKFYNAYMLIYE
jgi:hypothetical protein